MDQAMALYSFTDRDRSGKVRWTGEELGYSITEKRVSLGEHQQPEYLSLNPYGQIPTVVVDGQTMIGSTAICISLAEAAGGALIPAQADARSRFWEQVFLVTGTLENDAVSSYLSKAGIYNEDLHPLIEPALIPRLAQFASTVPENGWLIGSKFTLADIFAAYVLRIGVDSGLLEEAGALAAYLERLRARPAAQRARFFTPPA